VIPEDQLLPEGPPGGSAPGPMPEPPGPPGPPVPREVGPLRFGSLRPLRHRDFGLLWSAALVSNIGTWVQTVAVGALVTEMTGEARWTGLVAAAGFLPLGLLSPIGGVLADRVDRRRLLRLTTMGETFFATLLAVLAAGGHATPLAVSLVVLGGGCMAALGFPSYQAALPDLVPRDELLGAVSLSTAQWNLGRVVGPAIAGVVLVLGSYSLAFALNAVSFGAVLVALYLVRLPPPVAGGEEGGLWRRIVTGARSAWSEPGCRTAILTIGVAAFLLSPFIALIPAVAINLFGKGEGGTAVLITAQGVGAVAGALALTGVARRFGRARVLRANLVVLPGLLVLYALSPSLPVAAVALAAVGAAYIGILSGLSTVVQLRAPTAVRGRILSLYMVALGTIYPVGAVVQGALGDRFGLRAVTTACAVAFVLLVLVVRLARPGVAAALEDPATPAKR
jgi:MFS family permease